MTDQLTATLYQQDIRSGDCQALWWSCANGKTSILSLTLGFGANIDYLFKAQRPRSQLPAQPATKTPLLVAISNGQLHIVRFLLDLGADVTIPARGCPLIVGIIDSFYGVKSPEIVQEMKDLVKTLIEKGANPLYTTDWVCPLARVMIVNRAPLEMMELLFSHGADAMGQIGAERPARIWEWGVCGLRDRPEEEARLSLQKFRLLLQHSKVNELVNANGDTILHSLVDSCMSNRLTSNNRTSYLEVLLQEGVDVNMLSPIRGDTILERIAARMDDLVVAKRNWLGVVVDTRVSQRDSFLIGQALIIRLLDAGAQPNATSTASSFNLYGFGILFKGSVLTTLVRCEWDANEAISSLLQHGADTEITDLYGRGLLHLACIEASPNVAVVNTLLCFGLDPNKRDEKGRTALHALVGSPGNKESRRRVCKLLVKYGVDVYARDDGGKTAEKLGRKYYNILFYPFRIL